MTGFHHIANILANEVQEIVEGGVLHHAGVVHKWDDPFHLSDEQFRRKFRLSKELARNLIDIVEQHTASPTRTSTLRAKTKVYYVADIFIEYIFGCDSKAKTQKVTSFELLYRSRR
ncbi:hypothetical protein Trydic_g20769 [Trypoxylus dichotomus]